ncbi:MAG: protein kinase, partial [Gemmatimonadales bacterium]|nr:protein kinase [Gemmatimonadales bacterium]
MICPRCSIARIPDGTHECPLCGFKPASNVLVEQAAVDEAWQAVQQALGDRYWLEGLERLGERSFVYRARELATEREVALKVVPVSQSVDHELARRFERYAAQAAELRHAHIVPVFQYGVTRRFLWYAMEHVEARSLSEVLREPGPMELEPCLRIAEQVASALDFAYRRGVVHGNLKPSNILVDSRQWVRVTDFAVLEAFGRPRAPVAGAPVLHRPEYMAPEQFYARAVGASADQYALAVILYRCLSGSLPFVGDSFEEVARQQASDSPPRLADARRDLPVPVLDAIQRALSKVPAGRFPTVLDFTAALSGASRAATPVVTPQDTGAQPSESPLLVIDAPRRFTVKRVLAGAAAVVALALLASAGLRPDLWRSAAGRVGSQFGREAGSEAAPRWETLDPLPAPTRSAPPADVSDLPGDGEAESPPVTSPPTVTAPPARPAVAQRPGRLAVNSSPWG